MDKQSTTIDFMRHGEPAGGRCFRGSGIDDQLSEKGWQQMWDAVGESSVWNRLVSSPLKRCQQFARAMQDKHGLPLLLETDFREVGFGAWEGRTPDEIIAANSNEYDNFYADPVNNRPAGAESLATFGLRVANAFDNLVQQYPGEHLLVIAHAGVIRAALGHVLQARPSAWYRAKVDNAAITRFQTNKNGSSLVFHNLRPTPRRQDTKVDSATPSILPDHCH